MGSIYMDSVFTLSREINLILKRTFCVLSICFCFLFNETAGGDPQSLNRLPLQTTDNYCFKENVLSAITEISTAGASIISQHCFY